MSVNVWKECTENLFTPGGDPVWECPICGKGRHVYGIENADEPKYICPDCNSDLLYPWEAKGTLIANEKDYFAYNAYSCGWNKDIYNELCDKYMVFYKGGCYGIRLVPTDSNWAGIQFLVEDDGFLQTITTDAIRNYNCIFSAKYIDEITELLNEAKEFWINFKENHK